MDTNKLALVSNAMAMQVRCTLCNARVYEKCMNERGKDNEVVHIARMENYIRINMKD